MDGQKIEEYKKKLEEERTKLLATLKKGERHEDFGSDVDLDEEADEAESFGTQLAINQNLKERVSEIDMALNKIREGKFGLCDNCNKNIEETILNLSPASQFCQNCKKKKQA